MARKLKKKIVRSTADVPHQAAFTATPLDPGTAPVERFRSSVVFDRAIALVVKRKARERGLSFNGAVNLACFTWAHDLDRWDARPLTPPPVQSTFVDVSRGPRVVPRRPSEGYRLKKEYPDDDDCYASWEDVDRYDHYLQKHPTLRFDQIARRLNMDIPTARAADIARESQEYLRDKKWRRRMAAFNAEQASLSQKGTPT